MIVKFVCLLLITCYVSAYSQYIPQEIKSWLSSEELDKIRKADVNIDQGEQILFPELVKDSSEFKTRNYLQLAENLYVGNRVGRLLVESKGYFTAGFESKINVYKTYIDYYLRSERERASKDLGQLNDSIESLINEARLFRNKSAVKGSRKAAGFLIHKSNLNLQNAVLLCEKTMLKIKEKSIVNDVALDEVLPESDDKEKGSSVKKPEAKEVVPEIKEAVEDEVVKEVVPVKKEQVVAAEKKKADPEVYFTIQIVADRKPVSMDNIKKVYRGSLQVVENKGDGWYRYSLGKFVDLSHAKKELADSKVKGYVVAYKKGVRISVREALSYFESLNH